MYENLIAPMVLVLVIVFVVILPPVFSAGLKRIKDPVPLWLPVLVSGIVLAALAGLTATDLLRNAGAFLGTLCVFSLMLILVIFAVLTSRAAFGTKIRPGQSRFVLSLLTFIGTALFFVTTMGESREGMPLPPFASSLPLVGWIFDGLSQVLRVQDTVCSPQLPIHFIIVCTGLYLEVLLISAVYFLLLGALPAADDNKSQG